MTMVLRVALVLLVPFAFAVALAGEAFLLLARANGFVWANKRAFQRLAKGAIEILSYPVFGIARELGGFCGILWLVLLVAVFAALLAAVPWVRWLVYLAIIAGTLVIVPGLAKAAAVACDRLLDLWERFAEWVAATARAKGEARVGC